MLLPLFPWAIESLPLAGFDLVISSSHAVAKGAIAAPRALHLSYVHSPMRYIWEAADDYAPAVPGGPIGRAAFAALARRLRRWDVASTERVHAMAANSVYTQARIRRVYGRDSEVIEPPVDAARFARVPTAGPFAGRARELPLRLRPGPLQAGRAGGARLFPTGRAEAARRGGRRTRARAARPPRRPECRAARPRRRRRPPRPLRRLPGGRPSGARRLRHRPRRGPGGRAAGGRLRRGRLARLRA